MQFAVKQLIPARNRQKTAACDTANQAEKGRCVGVDDVESRFCAFSKRLLTDEQGRPLVVEGFQRQIPADCFAGARELVTILPKKRGAMQRRPRDEGFVNVAAEGSECP